MNKFKPADPVWAKIPDGEIAAVIVKVYGLCVESHIIYEAMSLDGILGKCCEPFIRPRRDDYQQHEPLGSRADLDKPLADKSPTPTEIEFQELFQS